MGYYVQIDAAGLFVAGGFYSHTPPVQVGRFRDAVDDDRKGRELVRLVKKVRSSGFEIGGDTLKTRPPRGVAEDHPRLDLMRHKSLTASRSYLSPPEWIETPPRAADEVRTAWRSMRPLVDWLTTVIGAGE